ncbi:transcriptional regulator [Sphingobium sp. LB126]|uniref:MucR family transcriptional regulator n=1 Tax=Sphingobium sp. LB126 TaxID=1983755 RepID=UPI000C20C6FD|nr:MucR family transcriptional regulator [Sphingobium sp. LB126]PJG45836.1 transcriptional regulator [Sphingobium sp. LB126]
MSEDNQPDITTLTVQLVSAFVSNNTVPSEGLADLIRTTRSALTEDPAAKAAVPAAPTFTPAVSVRKSLSSPEHILSMIDGKPYKTLKRHLASHGLTPAEYRDRYGLPKSYPLVAPNYSEARRAVATKLGLGRKPVSKKPATQPASVAAPVVSAKTAPVAAKTAPVAKPAEAKTPAAPKPAAAKAPAPKAKVAKAAPAAKAPAAKPAEAKAPAKATAPKAAASRKRLSIATPTAEKKDAPSAPAKGIDKPAVAAKAPAKAPAAKVALKKKPAAKAPPAKTTTPETAA